MIAQQIIYLFLTERLRDPVEIRNVWSVEVAVGVSLDDAIWIAVVVRVFERDD